ncbi:hypothetical protein [Caldimonas sp. KR1-144]|uniref:hypothetical protein n=1 Tax=Caldimonas sp. KR1-144 TaxID=3400911 RepID=UPI003C07982C
MSEADIRRQLEAAGYEPDQVDDMVAEWADFEVDRRRDEEMEVAWTPTPAST